MRSKRTPTGGGGSGLHARSVLLCLLSPFQHAGTGVLMPVPGLASGLGKRQPSLKGVAPYPVGL